MKLFAILAGVLLALSAHAEDINNSGTIAPILKCPAVPDAYAKMLTNLKAIKTQIKQEAACGPINQEVTGLEVLLGDRRTEVEALVEKSKTQALTEDELFKIRSYVEDITKKTLSVAQLFNSSNYCFIEDKKPFTFADLATITLDATALAKSVAGPYSIPIMLGGEALAGIFQGLNTFMQSQRGYDFTKLDQRQAYVKSLCAYYNYRQDLDTLLYPQKHVAQLQNLHDALFSHLKGLTDHCPECDQLSHNVTPNVGGALDAQAREIDSHYVHPVGTYTLRAVNILKFVVGEIQRVTDESTDDTSVGRDFLSETKADLDRFLFESQGPAFLAYQAKKGLSLLSEFRNYVAEESYNIETVSAVLGNPVGYDPFEGMTELQIIDAVAKLAGPARAANQPTLVARIQDFQAKALELYDRTRLASSVNQTYCTFFQRAGLYSQDLQNVCEAGNQARLQGELLKISGAKQPTPVTIDGVLAQNYVTDWTDSVQITVQTVDKDPTLYNKVAQ